MSSATPIRRARKNLVAIVSVLVTGIWLTALLTGRSWWLAFMLVGYIVIVPVVALLFGDEDDVEEWWDGEARLDYGTDEETAHREPTEEPSGDAALATLRERYARGELTDEQFERKVGQLLETETLEDVEDRAAADTARVESERSR